MKNLLVPFVVLCMMIHQEVSGQQMADTSFLFKVTQPAYPTSEEGPRILIDEAHHNFHTYSGRYQPFAELLASDGYQVGPFTQTFDSTSLSNCDILVVSNPLHPSDVGSWVVPNPSAFTNQEVSEVEKWVKRGGSLFLIADHMPFPGAAKTLGSVFGFGLFNGYAMPVEGKESPIIFRKSSGSLRGGPLLEGVDSVATFTGSAFLIPDEAEAVLVFDKNYHILLPDTAWRFHGKTTRMNLQGWCQGAVRDYGKGRVAVFGEAAMFTSQASGANRFGFSAPSAPDNVKFLLNIIHWLDGFPVRKPLPSVSSEIESHLQGMAEAYNQGEMERVASFYGKDAVMLGPGGYKVEGEKDLADYWTRISDPVHWKLESKAVASSFETLKQHAHWKQMAKKPVEWHPYVEIIGDEEIFYQLGVSTLQYKYEGKVHTSIVDFVLLWKRQEDGSFKILVDTYVGN